MTDRGVDTTVLHHLSEQQSAVESWLSDSPHAVATPPSSAPGAAAIPLPPPGVLQDEAAPKYDRFFSNWHDRITTSHRELWAAQSALARRMDVSDAKLRAAAQSGAVERVVERMIDFQHARFEKACARVAAVATVGKEVSERTGDEADIGRAMKTLEDRERRLTGELEGFKRALEDRMASVMAIMDGAGALLGKGGSVTPSTSAGVSGGGDTPSSSTHRLRLSEADATPVAPKEDCARTRGFDFFWETVGAATPVTPALVDTGRKALFSLPRRDTQDTANIEESGSVLRRMGEEEGDGQEIIADAASGRHGSGDRVLKVRAGKGQSVDGRYYDVRSNGVQVKDSRGRARCAEKASDLTPAGNRARPPRSGGKKKSKLLSDSENIAPESVSRLKRARKRNRSAGGKPSATPSSVRALPLPDSLPREIDVECGENNGSGRQATFAGEVVQGVQYTPDESELESQHPSMATTMPPATLKVEDEFIPSDSASAAPRAFSPGVAVEAESPVVDGEIDRVVDNSADGPLLEPGMSQGRVDMGQSSPAGSPSSFGGIEEEWDTPVERKKKRSRIVDFDTPPDEPRRSRNSVPFKSVQKAARHSKKMHKDNVAAEAGIFNETVRGKEARAKLNAMSCGLCEDFFRDCAAEASDPVS